MNNYITYTSNEPIEYRGNVNHIININIAGKDKKYRVVTESREIKSVPEDIIGWSRLCFQQQELVYHYDLEEVKFVKVKRKEEIAAEESVAKAKEALKAAENSLKVIKDEGK